jgi:hypothetical protein
MPLMPAIRPLNSISNSAPAPISKPPNAAEMGSKGCHVGLSLILVDHPVHRSPAAGILFGVMRWQIGRRAALPAGVCCRRERSVLRILWRISPPGQCSQTEKSLRACTVRPWQSMVSAGLLQPQQDGPQESALQTGYKI